MNAKIQTWPFLTPPPHDLPDPPPPISHDTLDPKDTSPTTTLGDVINYYPQEGTNMHGVNQVFLYFIFQTSLFTFITKFEFYFL
jgi:hypothetical protein